VRSLDHVAVFSERLILISSPTSADQASPRRRGPFDHRISGRLRLSPHAATLLGRDSLASFRVLDLSSYHAIVACVTAGAGLRWCRAVLDAMPHVNVRRHSIPKAHAKITTRWCGDVASCRVGSGAANAGCLLAEQKSRA